MKHFLTFQKKKALFIPEGIHANIELARQLNHELMQYGFILTSELENRLSQCSIKELDQIYHDLLIGIQRIIPGGGHEMIYKGFPQSVINLPQEEFINNAIKFYQSNGAYIPEEPIVKKIFNIELIDYKPVGLITKQEFENIFYNIIYSNNSINQFDKEIVEWFLYANYPVDFNKIVFKETLAYIGKKLLDAPILILPTRNATDILRIWSVYSSGDEGLKENTRFKNPSSKHRQLLLNSLNNCYNLEDEFKLNREKWLRLLYFLHPMTPKNRNKYSKVAEYTNKLRNSPKELLTFNSKVEKAISEKDTNIFLLLKNRMGVFSRRLDHLIRVFGEISVEKWLENLPRVNQLIDVYNHLYGRDKVQNGRTAILANQSTSEVVNYKELTPLSTKIIQQSRHQISNALENALKGTLGKVYIDPLLYLRPLSSNNRASSFSIDGKAIGTVELIPEGKTIRAYVFWQNSSDIDLSGLVIDNNNNTSKVGWNGASNFNAGGVVYSGDNTGNYDKNAEYIDITPELLPVDTEWVILEARIYRGPNTYHAFTSNVLMGWMLRDTKSKNGTIWKPDTTQNSMSVTSKASICYLSAYHVPTRNLVYLDVSKGNKSVSNGEDALKMRVFLDKFINSTPNGINWDKINQGHILHLLATEVVSDPKDADKVFTANTSQEEIMVYI